MVTFFHYMMVDSKNKFAGFLTEKSPERVKALAKYYKVYGYKISGRLFSTHGDEQE